MEIRGDTGHEYRSRGAGRGPFFFLVSPLTQLAKAGHSTLPKPSIRLPEVGLFIQTNFLNRLIPILAGHDNALAFVSPCTEEIALAPRRMVLPVSPPLMQIYVPRLATFLLVARLTE